MMKPEPQQKVLYSKAVQGSSSGASVRGGGGPGMSSANMSHSPHATGPNMPANLYHKGQGTGGSSVSSGSGGGGGGGVVDRHFHAGNSPRNNMNTGNMRGNIGKSGQQSNYSNRHNQVYQSKRNYISIVLYLYLNISPTHTLPF